MGITERIDRTNNMDEEGWKQTILPCPKSVKISLDDNCQFKCSFCVNSTQAPQDKKRLDWDMFTKLIDELVENGVEEIGLFFIGEPMLAKNLEQAIRYCKSKGVEYVFITTNGALATAERVKPLFEAGLDSIKFSFNYTGMDHIKQIANVPGRTFDKLVENIRAVHRLRQEGGYKCGIYASSIMFAGTQQEHMQGAVDQIKDYVDEHYWLPQYSFGAQASLKTPIFGNPGRLDRMRPTLPCWTIFKEGHVTAAGAVSLCCFDVHDKWCAGNLHDMTFMEAWNSEIAQKLRAAHLAGNARGTACEECAHGKS